MKMRIVKAMGGKCQVCGYAKCDAALDLHHIDQTQKEFGFGRYFANIKGALSVVAELKKCALLCSNCHREVHAGITESPSVSSFNEEMFLSSKTRDFLLEPSSSG